MALHDRRLFPVGPIAEDAGSSSERLGSVSWWLLSLKEQSPGGSVGDLSLSRDGPNRQVGFLLAELAHLPSRSIVQTRAANVLPLDSCSRHSGFHAIR